MSETAPSPERPGEMPPQYDPGRWLSGIEPSEYGPSYRDHVLDVYKVYLEMADRISERREKANSFFLAINTALVALLAKDAFGNATHSTTLEVLVPLSAIVMCYLWNRIIRSYRDINSAKFKVIHQIERRLPIRPYDAEWASVGRGKEKSLYLPFTHVEQLVPWLFLLFHAILALTAVPWQVVLAAFQKAG
ncbi:MAG: hypothetical protein H6838_19850 [Planctomycetes bacterium]|nr:hypothetical protein [Planctomycetota bacterium]